MYGLYKEAYPAFEEGRWCTEFPCAKPGCSVVARHYLDPPPNKEVCSDVKSTGRLNEHAKVCWGREVYKSMLGKTLDEVRKVIQTKDPTHIDTHFARARKGKVTYRTTQHTTMQRRYVKGSQYNMKLMSHAGAWW